MVTFNLVGSKQLANRIKSGKLLSISNKNYKNIYKYISPVKDDDNVLTIVESVTRIYKSNHLFKYLVDHIEISFVYW